MDTPAPGLEKLVSRSPWAELSIQLPPEFVRDRGHTQEGGTNGYLWMDALTASYRDGMVNAGLQPLSYLPKITS